MIEPSAPPLGDYLFPELVRVFPSSWGRLQSDLQAIFTSNGFEAGMVALLENGYPSNASRLLLEMACYFSDFTFSTKDSLYHRIVRGIRRGRAEGSCTIGSMNYECLFEIAADQLGLRVNYDPVRARDSLTVLKLHGSCNFLPDLRGNSFIDVEISGLKEINIFQGPISAVSPGDVKLYALAGESIPPAMSFYAPDKHTPVSAAAIDAVRREWADSCESANAIFIIGCRPLRADSHVFDSIVCSGAKVYMVGGSNADEFELFTSEIGSQRFEYIADRCDEARTRIDRLLTRLLAT